MAGRVTLPALWGGPGWRLPEVDIRRLVGGKLSHRLRDLGRARHEEVLLGRVERHRRDVRCGDADHRSVQAVESVLRDDGRYLRAKPASEIVFVDDHRFACLADRFENRVAVERGQGAEIDDLDADTVRLELLGRLEAVVRHESPREAA